MQAEQRAIKTAHLAERQVLLRQNSAILDDFMARLKRPISAAEAQTLLKANGGLDIPEDNALNLRPMTAAPQLPPRAPYSEIGDCMCVVSITGNCELVHRYWRILLRTALQLAMWSAVRCSALHDMNGHVERCWEYKQT